MKQFKSVMTFGLVKSQETSGFFGKDAIVPHAMVFTVNMLLVMLFANADINSRVASTCPFYFWASAVILCQDSKMAKFISMHNLAYMLLNFVLF